MLADNNSKFSVDREPSAIMCHHTTPCSSNCGSEGMAVDLSLCDHPTSLPIVLTKLEASSKTISCTPPANEPDCKVDGSDSDLQRWPASVEIMTELREMGSIAGPMLVLGALFYIRSVISMLFLGRLGDLELAGGSLAIGFANITGYSVLGGLCMGMEPICGQAFGAKRWDLIGLTLQRMTFVLLVVSVPIALLWINMQRILALCGQDAEILAIAHTFLMFTLPDLAAVAMLSPLRIYMRSQQLTKPLMYSALLAVVLHVLINLLLVDCLGLSVRGVALATGWSNFNLVVFLLGYLLYSGLHKAPGGGFSSAAFRFREWSKLLCLSIPSCVSVCLEWWWYEFMIILSGLLVDAQATVASMGILIQTTALVYIFPSALSMAVSTRVGHELGANRPGRARTAMLVALGCAVVVGVLACTFTSSMRHIWATMFTKDQKILSLTALVLPIVGLCELGNCPQTTGCGVLRGSARPTTGANINLGSFYFVGMPVALALGFWLDIGFAGLWFGLFAAQLTCAGVMLTVLLRTDWIRQAERAKDLTAHPSQATAKVADFSDVEECFVHKPLNEEIEAEEREALISVKVVQPHTSDCS